ncbi:unnamed protein product, partial [Brassica rapa subsp. trilocularis]
DERQARGRRERSTSPLDRSHKSRPSQDRATTASRNDEGSNARGSGAEPNDEEEPSFELSGKLAEETNRYRGLTLWILAAPTRLTSMFLLFHSYCAGAISTFLY